MEAGLKGDEGKPDLIGRVSGGKKTNGKVVENEDLATNIIRTFKCFKPASVFQSFNLL